MHEYQHEVLKVRSTGQVAMCLQEKQRIWPGGEMEKVKMSCLDWAGVMTRPDSEEYQWASDPMEKRSNRQSEGFSK